MLAFGSKVSELAKVLQMSKKYLYNFFSCNVAWIFSPSVFNTRRQKKSVLGQQRDIFSNSTHLNLRPIGKFIAVDKPTTSSAPLDGNTAGPYLSRHHPRPSTNKKSRVVSLQPNPFKRKVSSHLSKHARAASIGNFLWLSLTGAGVENSFGKFAFPTRNCRTHCLPSIYPTRTRSSGTADSAQCRVDGRRVRTGRLSSSSECAFRNTSPRGGRCVESDRKLIALK